MNNFDEKKYLETKKNEIEIIGGTNHGKIVEDIMKKDFEKIKKFPYKSYEDI